MLFCIRHFSHTINFSKIFYPKIDLFLHHFPRFFITFSALIFASFFFIDFWWKMAPKWSPKVHGAESFLAPFSRPFRLCWFYVDFMLNLAHLGLPFGALWLTLGSLWLTFGSLLAHFWCPLAHFWCLGLTFGDPGARFSRFWCPLASFSIFRFTTWMGS